MREQFDLQREFPNYFKKILDRTGSYPEMLTRIENLLSANMQSLINRLNVAYVNQNGSPTTDRFFEALLKKMRDSLPANVNKDDLQVYISGGVVRALLAYIYKELHIQLNEQSSKIAPEFRSINAEKKRQESAYLQLQNYLLDNVIFSNNPIHYEYIKDHFLGSDKAGETKKIDFLLALVSDLTARHQNPIHNQSVRDIDPEYFEKYTKLYDDEYSQEKYSQERLQLWQSMEDAEYYLLRSYMIEQTPLLQAFVLGVGSDLDILYELKGDYPNAVEIKQNIESVGMTFINSAQKHFKHKLSKESSVLTNSVVPVADIKDYQEQIPSVLKQGGSMLDTLAFKITINTGVTNKDNEIREPMLNTSIVPVMKTFIQGFYDYIANSNASSKQTIRGLRALLEIPFLQLSPQGKEVIIQELNKINDNGSLSFGANAQIAKMIRNANFSGANNRAYRESSDQPLSIFLNMINKLTPSVDTKIKKAFPKFLESFHNRTVSAEYTALDESQLIGVDDFVRNYTNNGELYHGTYSENILPILRAGFFISDREQGTSYCGSGLYTTGKIDVAKTYAAKNGKVLKFHINQSMPLRIVDLRKLDSHVCQNLQNEANESGQELNELLRTRYKVDIIINDHVLIQNIDAIIRSKNLSLFIDSISAEMQRLTTELEPGLLIKYKELREFSKILDCDTRSMPSEHRLIVDFITNKQNEIKNATHHSSGYNLIYNVSRLLDYFYRESIDDLDLSLTRPPFIDELTERLLKIGALSFAKIPPLFRDNQNIIRILIEKNGMNLKDASERIRADETIVLSAVQRDGLALEFAGEKLKKNERIVMIAVQNDGMALQFADESLKDNEAIVMAAVQNNPLSLRFAGPSVKNNIKIVMAAIQKDGRAVAFAGEQLKANLKIAIAALKNNTESIKYLCDDLKDNYEIRRILNLCSSDSNSDYDYIGDCVDSVDDMQEQSPSLSNILKRELALDMWLKADDSTFLIETVKRYPEMSIFIPQKQLSNPDVLKALIQHLVLPKLSKQTAQVERIKLMTSLNEISQYLFENNFISKNLLPPPLSDSGFDNKFDDDFDDKFDDDFDNDVSAFHETSAESKDRSKVQNYIDLADKSCDVGEGRAVSKEENKSKELSTVNNVNQDNGLVIDTHAHKEKDNVDQQNIIKKKLELFKNENHTEEDAKSIRRDM